VKWWHLKRKILVKSTANQLLKPLEPNVVSLVEIGQGLT
jgi:hypothetical protein